MIPQTLDEWSTPVITTLLIQGYYESEYFDFKEMLPHNKDDRAKQRLYKTCCAFANSSGGFLVFGIKDAKAGEPIESRLVGIEPAYDFPEHFGAYPQKCSPSVTWDFKNPPIQLGNGKLIHIVYIPRSWNTPHCVETQGEGSDKLRCFSKRSNKGNEDMSYEEIRLSFLQYYEKRLKLQLLKTELENIKKHAEELIISPPRASVEYFLGEFSLTVLETVLADTYTILVGNKELLDALVEIRGRCRVVNNMLQILIQVATINAVRNNTQPQPFIEMHNRNVEGECKPLVFNCTHALKLLENILNA